MFGKKKLLQTYFILFKNVYLGMSNTKKQLKMVYKINEKKEILARFIEVLVHTGYDIKPFIYKPLSNWDYDNMIQQTIDIATEHDLTLDEREIEFLENQEQTIEEETIQETNEEEELTIDELAKIGREKYTNEEAEEVLKAVDFIETDNKYETQEKFENSTTYNYENFCQRCGRGIKGEPKFGLNTIEGPKMVPFNTTEKEMAKYGQYTQGLFYIGSECRKHYPKEYIGKL